MFRRVLLGGVSWRAMICFAPEAGGGAAGGAAGGGAAGGGAAGGGAAGGGAEGGAAGGGAAGGGAAGGGAAGGGNKEIPGFLHQASPEVREGLAALGHKTFDEFGKSHLEFVKNAGANRVVLPGENATPEEVSAFNLARGVPKDAKEYGDFTVDGVKADPGMADFARQVFPKIGITKKDAPVAIKEWNTYVAGVLKANGDAEAKRMADGDAALAQEWKADLPAKMDIANRAAEFMKVSPEKIDALKKAWGPKDAMVFLHDIGQRVATDGENPGNGGGDRGGFNITTPAQAKAEIERMNSDPAIVKAATDPSHKDHQAVKEKKARLLLIRDGNRDPGRG